MMVSKATAILIALGIGVWMSVGSLQGTETAPRRLAVLVGINDYDSLPPERDLLGPANDVRLIRDVLLERGFKPADISVLADDIAGAGEPTRRRILRAWDQLVRQSKAGDEVFIYFAGHGSQQPTDDSTEADGLEEIILPKDIGRWDGAIGHVTNAITDNEIAAFLGKLQDNGVDVWAVFDACHSETLTRSAGAAGERQRYVDPQDVLGIPSVASSGTRREALLDSIEQTHSNGRLTAFFAAASTEPTPELRLPKGHPERRYHGLFSYTLAQALRSSRLATYRDLANAMLLQYAQQSRRTPTPKFSGDLDRLALGSSSVPLDAWPARLAVKGSSYVVSAGALHRLKSGSILELLTADGAPTGHAIELSDVDLSVSRGDLQGSGDKAPEIALARLRQPVMEFSLGVCSDESEVDAAVRSSGLLHSATLPECDVLLVREADEYWLLDASMRMSKGANRSKRTPHVVAGDGDGILELLVRAARTRNLLTAIAGTPTETVGLSVSAAVETEGAPGRQIQVGEIDVLKNGDEVVLRLENAADDALDVTVLFIDAHNRIYALWPAGDQDNRLEPGSGIDWRGRVDTAETMGREQVLIFATPGAAGRVPTDYRFLASRQPLTRGNTSHPLQTLLYHAGFQGGTTRGLSAASTAPTQVQVLTWVAE